MLDVLTDETDGSTPIIGIEAARLEQWLEGRGEAERQWLRAIQFKAEPDETALVPAADGSLAFVLHGINAQQGPWRFAGLPGKLPAAGCFHLSAPLNELEDPAAASRMALGWALGSYQFGRYKQRKRAPARLAWPDRANRAEVAAIAKGVVLARDLVNTPAEDLGPAELADAAIELARKHGAETEIHLGEALLRQNYPLIHAVGRGSARAPRLVDLHWGEPDRPKLTLVGKGVCFDSGGYDLKTSSGMKLMKKDMGGAATVLGLAHAIMATGLRVRLRVLIPAVENSVSSTAFRPLDVFRSRKGLTVEIGNTDAEGRLVLADALAAASDDQPDLIIDMATLTGAARTALGPELPALFCNNDALAAELLAAGEEEMDPLWRLPLWAPYRRLLDSKTADINNASDSSFAGAITASLFLREFVGPEIPWIHIDTYAWNPEARPGRPEGGEALGLRALYRMLQRRYG